MNIIFAVLIYGALFIVIESASKIFPLSKEFWRKIIHIFAGLFSAALPFMLPLSQIFFLGIFFGAAMLFSKKINLLGSIHQISRRSYGEVFFPLSISIVAWVFPNKILYIYAVLILSISDGLAGLIGQKFGVKIYKLFSEKSYVGSFTFFVSAVLIGVVMLPLFGLPLWQSFVISTILAVLLTVTEGIMPLGLDNLILPPLAAFLLSFALNNSGIL